MKFHSNPVTMIKNKKLIEPNSANVYIKPEIKSYRGNNEDNIDLQPKAEHFTQPDVRIKTTIGGYRSRSPKFLSNKASAVKPKSSSKLKRVKINGKNLTMNKYHALIDQAFKMTAKQSAYESQKFLQTQSKLSSSNSNKEMAKSASQKQTLKSNSRTSTVSKLRSQFRPQIKPSKNAKDLLKNRKFKKPQMRP